MGKKEIIIIVSVFVGVLLLSIASVYFISNRESVDNKKDTTSSVLKVGSYTLNYGTYKGIEKEYDYDTDTTKEKEISLTLSENKINGRNFEIKGTSLYLNGIEMYQVIANNKILLLAGEGVEFKYEK